MRTSYWNKTERSDLDLRSELASDQAKEWCHVCCASEDQKGNMYACTEQGQLFVCIDSVFLSWKKKWPITQAISLFLNIK